MSLVSVFQQIEHKSLFFFKVQAGRPIYKHESAQQYLYYHPYSGGNWLINTEIGLLYGGIQNSKDVPVCPYLINTMWQYGDSDLGGWVYDGSLKVTCPTDPCSGLIYFSKISHITKKKVLN